MIRWGGFDSLGHLTYPLRYIVGDHGIPVELTQHREQIDGVFRALIMSWEAGSLPWAPTPTGRRIWEKASMRAWSC